MNFLTESLLLFCAKFCYFDFTIRQLNMQFKEFILFQILWNFVMLLLFFLCAIQLIKDNDLSRNIMRNLLEITGFRLNRNQISSGQVYPDFQRYLKKKKKKVDDQLRSRKINYYN